MDYPQLKDDIQRYLRYAYENGQISADKCILDIYAEQLADKVIGLVSPKPLANTDAAKKPKTPPKEEI